MAKPTGMKAPEQLDKGGPGLRKRDIREAADDYTERYNSSRLRWLLGLIQLPAEDFKKKNRNHARHLSERIAHFCGRYARPRPSSRCPCPRSKGSRERSAPPSKSTSPASRGRSKEALACDAAPTSTHAGAHSLSRFPAMTWRPNSSGQRMSC